MVIKHIILEELEVDIQWEIKTIRHMQLLKKRWLH